MPGHGKNSAVSTTHCWICKWPLVERIETIACYMLGCDERDCLGHTYSEWDCSNPDKYRQQAETVALAKEQDKEIEARYVR